MPRQMASAVSPVIQTKFNVPTSVTPSAGWRIARTQLVAWLRHLRMPNRHNAVSICTRRG